MGPENGEWKPKQYKEVVNHGLYRTGNYEGTVEPRGCHSIWVLATTWFQPYVISYRLYIIYILVMKVA